MSEEKKDGFGKRATRWIMARMRPLLRKVVKRHLLPLLKAEIEKGADRLYERIEEKALEFVAKL